MQLATGHCAEREKRSWVDVVATEAWQHYAVLFVLLVSTRMSIAILCIGQMSVALTSRQNFDSPRPSATLLPEGVAIVINQVAEQKFASFSSQSKSMTDHDVAP